MAERTYQAISKTIDGLQLEEFDDAIYQLAEPFDNNKVYSVGNQQSNGSFTQQNNHPNPSTTILHAFIH